MCILKSSIAAAMLGAVLFPLSAAGQQPIFYPAKGQSAQQQNRDQGQCQVWAQQTTGINPAALAQTPAPQAPSGPGIGEASGWWAQPAGPSSGKSRAAMVAKARRSAPWSAARARGRTRHSSSRLRSRVRMRRTHRITYNRAVGACMEGRGYTVR